MLSRFDSLYSISGSKPQQAENTDYFPDFKVQGQALSRTFTEDLSEAHDAMSSLGGFAPKRLNAEPSMRRILKELDVGPASDSEDDGGDDGDESSEEDPAGPPQVTQSFFQPAPATNPPAPNPPAPTRTGNLAEYNRYAQFRMSTCGSFSNLLDNIPVPSPLETAPPPDFSAMALPNPEYPVYQDLDTFMDEEEDGVEIEPLPLSSLIHVREDTPTPSRRPHTHAPLRRASTNPAVHVNVAHVAPRTPIRGASASHAAARSPTSEAPRRSERLQAKGGNSPQKTDRKGSGGFRPY
ncbi:uncharacterized protein TRAVEDRAFT_53104 [Trametes versicolor FP-101664 SS1]|uniref:uncharacterized protein n=1 Tax=Trametes versicolor (strain FP-101664) TaxID=717944 RepID=UPI0004622501|nr:uncharacterized protein TRAVEDRAFT_53104 [Trametes versicolor FP-101664 SS1]EIW52663.1 hypothetical protein TRAVEDRAFT_53104 [Trametes versicolor FP-101664 SS1]